MRPSRLDSPPPSCAQPQPGRIRAPPQPSVPTFRCFRLTMCPYLTVLASSAAAEVRDMRDSLGDSEFSSFMSVRACGCFPSAAAAHAAAQHVAH